MVLGNISVETPGTNIRTAALLCSDLTSLVDFWTSRCFGWREIIWRMEASHRLISKHCIMWDTGGFKRCLVELRRWPKLVQHSKISCGIENLVVYVSQRGHTLYWQWMVPEYVGNWIFLEIQKNGHHNNTHIDCAFFVGETSHWLLSFAPLASQFPSLHSYFGSVQVILFRLWLFSDSWSAPQSTQPSSRCSVKTFPEHRLLLVWIGDN